MTLEEFPESLNNNPVLNELSQLLDSLGLVETDEMKNLSRRYISIVQNTEELTPEITHMAVDIMDEYEDAVNKQMAEAPGNVLLPIAWILKKAEITYLGDSDTISLRDDLKEASKALQAIKANPDFMGNTSYVARAALIEEWIHGAQNYLDELE